MRVALVVGIFASASCAFAQNSESLFPRPESLEPAVAFWTRVYTEVDTRSGFVHDNRHLDVVYETLHFGPGVGSRQRRRQTSRATEEYQEILTKLSRGARDDLSDKEARVLALWPQDVSNSELAAAAARVRFQLGQADRFRRGLERSGIWKAHIREVLEQRGLPLELAALPHVESSFDPTAYSHVGAAGMWQFTRSTGLRYMQIDHIVDERRDPFLSTYAAARLLADNFAVIQSWPLALTAYNHGLAGMRRAVDRLNTKDIGVIVERYDGRTFGFASRNFYAAFLAALDIDSDPSRYFDDLEIRGPAKHDVVHVPDYVAADTLAASLGISKAELQRLNPALTETVWAGDKFVPKGFEIRLPVARVADAQRRVDGIPASERYAAQRPDLYHRVQSGDTLSQVAERYGVSLAALVRINGLRSRNFIRIGQVLTLPVSGPDTPATLDEPQPVLAAADGTYIVRRGDSIDRISRRLGLDAARLVAINNLTSDALIYPGQSLTLPDPSDTSSTAPAATALAAVQPPEIPTPSAATEDERTETLIANLDGNAPARESEAEVLTGEASTEASAGDAVLVADHALASAQADLAGDPSDYSVAADGSIEVQAMETLGHYADWLGIATQRLRDLNGLSFRQAVVIGQRIALDFAQTDIATFERRRIAFQRERQESFFSAYQIESIVDHVVRPGESLWILAQRTYNVPVWLLRQYNPDLNLDRVSPGTVVKFPNLKRVSEPQDAVRS
jgi:membrane-bound lytic murein transglycosylase D